ncbi:MAG: VOC family protein [Dehalococcoidales bacterium]|nr:VOC family protein [Dehalococcoidales bacterium]
MNKVDSIREKFNLPPVTQLGIVVKDTDKAVEYYSSVFGIGPFQVFDWGPDRHWINEKPAPVKYRLGMAKLGDLEIELMQPLVGRSLHQEFLEIHGEGIQHLGFHINDYDETFNNFTKAGFKPLMRAEHDAPENNGMIRAAYFDTQQIGGIIFEIIWMSWLQKK